MIRTALTVLVAAAFGACSRDHDQKSDAGAQAGEAHAHGPHGGHVLELGSAHAAHLEVVHDDRAGTLTIYVLGADSKTALAASKPPELKLNTSSGPKVLATKPKDTSNTVFTVTDDALKGKEPEGRISIEVDGKTYNPDLEHNHGNE